ncbi:MAG: hypothetical protein LAN36_16105 [Acidobacteriia bacterium]|nr:hypothetical protein [Terriglobia bacterium]
MNKRPSNGALVVLAVALTILSTLSIVAAQEPAAIPVESESHHHVVLENFYVRVLFVEIPAHESTLLHHHDLPYVSVPPGGADAVTVPAGAQQGTAPFRVGYSPGGFSHAVSNSSDRTLRNVAIELVRPQGKVQNRCEVVVRGQPSLGICEPMNLDALRFYKLPAFETDEILVEQWSVRKSLTSHPMKFPRDMLFAGLTDVTISAGRGIDSANAPHGVLWVPARSKIILKTASEKNGHFYSITFKDSRAGKH